jgi:hypothetical protein
MTTALTANGRPVRFPGTFKTDAEGDIIPPASEEQLLVFATRLIRHTRKRQHQLLHAKLNRSRLELARLCLDRTLRDLI